MSESLLYPVGTSGIALNGRQRFKNYYGVTKKLLEEMKNETNCKYTEEGIQWSLNTPLTLEYQNKNAETIEGKINIIFPIILKIMETIKRKSSDFGKRENDKIFLFTTEQSLPHPSDTKFAGILIKKFLTNKFRMDENVIELIEIKENPSDYDKMSEFFHRFINNHKETLKYNATNYVSLTAGTPAEIVNLALVVNNLPVDYLYLSRDENEVKYYEVFKGLNKERYKNLIKTLIDNYDYTGAINILNESPYRSKTSISDLLNMLIKRRECSFKEAFNYIKDLKFPYRNELSNLARGDRKAIFSEFFYLIEIYFRKEYYIEAISQLFSLLDNLLQYLFNEITGKETKKTAGKFKEYNDYITSNPGLKNYLENKGIEWENNPSRLALMGIIKWHKDNGKIRSINVEPILKFFDKVNSTQRVEEEELSLLDLRSKLRLAHGYRAVSKDLIEKLYEDGVKKLVEDLKNALDLLSIPVKENFYTEINKYIIDKL